MKNGSRIQRFNRQEASRVKHYALYIMLLLLLTIHYPLFTAWADDRMLRIQKAYENIKDIKGRFVQKSHIKDLKKTDVYIGEFFIKTQKMRWEYKGDKPQVVYITGEDIIIYQIKEKQAFKAKFDRATYGQAPIALLGGLGNIKDEFDVSIKTEVRTQNTEQRLLLKPKKQMGNIVSIELFLSDKDFPIESLIIFDALSNKIEIQITDVKINTGLKDNIFNFSPPEGVTIFAQ